MFQYLYETKLYLSILYLAFYLLKLDRTTFSLFRNSPPFLLFFVFVFVFFFLESRLQTFFSCPNTLFFVAGRILWEHLVTVIQTFLGSLIVGLKIFMWLTTFFVIGIIATTLRELLPFSDQLGCLLIGCASFC